MDTDTNPSSPAGMNDGSPTVGRELQDVLQRLAAAGLLPEICDVAVPRLTAEVLCGRAVPLGDVAADDYLWFPRSLAGVRPTVVVRARGDSMEAAGIGDGDEVTVELCDTAVDGDVVVAEVDGECMIKTLVRDERGRVWLVPANAAYDAVLVGSGQTLRVFGRVTGVRKRVVAPSYADTRESIRQAMAKAAGRRGQHPDGRRVKPLCSMVASGLDQGECLWRMRRSMEGRGGRDLALAVMVALRMGWLRGKPSFTQLSEAFGVTGTERGYNHAWQMEGFTADEMNAVRMEMERD